ncbi:mRNA capping enzyme, alpha subunit [Dothidotthia symphoricarpi CBS 119687]|uniref:mRNA guanylyltransferase n=1 Tax=Dothidotthia symphoricarpi CBS 119687 TaxID=1392245 RepID=A0A6A6A4L4_9PLEO|nr:mRNA capping enzyme, alpha subunit [Dothidotthia symphoricarpi CBS 119687]KAF2126103.1 mRNA capping enzyme, alpha subunit [Dothidotthia symphoricarpi CBS 119687]
MPSAAPVHAPPPQMPGYLVDNHDAQQLRQDVANLIGRDNPRFPGAQPVSFSREHIAELQRAEYFMCEKTDGLRCLLYMAFTEDATGRFEPVTFLIDRKNNYYNVQPAVRVPFWEQPKNPDAFLYGTILDGELVNDQYPGEATPRLIYYVFDCLTLNGDNLTPKTFDKRFARLRDWVLAPYNSSLPKTAVHIPPFRLREKNMWPQYSFRHTFDQVLPNLRHGNDGLIFTCKATRYEFGTDRHTLKWKPPHENTIDFKLRLGEFPLIDPQDGEDGPIPDYTAIPAPITLLVQHNKNQYEPFAELALTPAEWHVLMSLDQRLDGRIIECYRTPQGQWKYKAEADGSPRWRDDKKDANHISTVNSVLESIENPVTEDDLRAMEPRLKEAVYRLQGREPPKADGERDPKKRKVDEAGLNGNANGSVLGRVGLGRIAAFFASWTGDAER